QAGYEVRQGRMVHKETGKPLEFEILLVQKDFERVVQPFIKNLQRLGVRVTARSADTSQYINRVRSCNYDMIVLPLPQSDSPRNEQRDYWSSVAVDSTGSRNYIGVKDPGV